MNVAYNMDCMEYMRSLPNKAFELAIVDPPYGINAPNMTMGSNLSRKGDGYPGESVAQRLKKRKVKQRNWQVKKQST